MAEHPLAGEGSGTGRQPWGGCRVCKHLQPGMRCVAFPDGIPMAIFSGQVDHLSVRPGQRGTIVFELTEAPDELALRRIRAGVARGEQWALAAAERLGLTVTR